MPSTKDLNRHLFRNPYSDEDWSRFRPNLMVSAELRKNLPYRLEHCFMVALVGHCEKVWGECEAPPWWIAEEMKVSTATVKRITKTLIDENWLVSIKKRDRFGHISRFLCLTEKARDAVGKIAKHLPA